MSPEQKKSLTDPVTGYVYALPDWVNRLNPEQRFTLISSGRGGGGKTRTLGFLMIKFALEKPRTILCVREIQQNLSESSITVIKQWLQHPKLRHLKPKFRFYGSRVYVSNGSVLHFRGLSDKYKTSDGIKSFEGADICWVDEAQTITQKSMSDLLPTIRKKGSRFFFTYNPRLPTDPISIMAKQAREDKDIDLLELTRADNPYFESDSDLEKERLRCLRNEPHLYAHIWEGQYVSDNPFSLIPYVEFAACRQNWTDEQISQAMNNYWDAGFDIAISAQGDYSAYCQRSGGFVSEVKKWRGKTLKQSAEELHRLNNPVNDTIFYDMAGVGRSFIDYEDDFPQTAFTPTNFGGAVSGKRVKYSYQMPNGEYFARRNSQLYWALRLRVKNTLRYLDGENVPLSHCILLSSNIPLQTIEELCSEAATAEYSQKSGKLSVDKSPGNSPSPNLLDAVSLSFAQDSKHGLREDFRESSYIPAIFG